MVASKTGGIHHARYRALSVPAGPEDAVDRGPGESGCKRAARVRMGRAFGGREVGVSSMLEEAAALRSRRGTDVAASGQLPVQDLPERAHPPRGMRGAWRGPG